MSHFFDLVENVLDDEIDGNNESIIISKKYLENIIIIIYVYVKISEKFDYEIQNKRQILNFTHPPPASIIICY